MKVTPRHLVQLSSAEIAFLHALVQQQVRSFVAEHPEGRGMGFGVPPPELTSLDRRLLARLGEAAAQEEAYFSGRRPRAEAICIDEEHAAFAQVVARQERTFPSTAAFRSDAVARQAVPWTALKRTRQHAAR